MMHFKQFYLGCLAHASYLIASGDEAAVVDPQRDVEHYIDEARANGFRIKYVIETHLHADFVSGHCELAERTGATIVIGRAASAEFPHLAASEGTELRIGNTILRAIETPGHTPESVCWLVMDGDDSSAPKKLLTGDTLYIGDVGRPDLAGSRGFTSADMAGMMWSSLQKLLSLDDSVEVYPAHGAGSACGRNISRERSSTIGEQRRSNWALQSRPKEEFVKMMTTDLAPPPRYFSMDAELNRRGAVAVGTLEARPLPVGEVKRQLERGTTILDVRDAATFGSGHIPRSLNIGLGGEFASWCGSLLDPKQPLVIVAADEDGAKEAIVRLARVGLENAAGYLDGGFEAWTLAGEPVSTLPQWTVGDLEAQRGKLQVVDVRQPAEFAGGHVPGSINLPLRDLPSHLQAVDPSRPVAVICGGGYRSSAAASLMRQSGLQDLQNVTGGFSAWVRAGFATE